MSSGAGGRPLPQPSHTAAVKREVSIFHMQSAFSVCRRNGRNGKLQTQEVFLFSSLQNPKPQRCVCKVKHVQQRDVPDMGREGNIKEAGVPTGRNRMVNFR